MGNAALISFVLVLVLLPVWGAADPVAPRGLKRSLVGLLGFGLLYAWFVAFVFTEHFRPGPG